MTGGDAQTAERAARRADPGERSLRANVVGGLRWSFLSQLASRALSFVSGIVVFRLLVPDDFGVYAFALATMGVLLTVNDVGLDTTVIRFDGDPERAARAGSAMALGVSAITYALCFLGAPLLAELAHAPTATNPIRLMATVVLIDGAIVTPRALLVRGFRQREVALADVATAVVNALAAASLATLGAGVWAPTVAVVMGALVNGAVILGCNPRYPWPRWDPQVLRGLARSGLLVAAASLVELLLLNVDSLLAANTLGTGQLAFYALAFNVSSWPVTILSQAVRRVSISGFSNIADEPERVHDACLAALRLLVALVTPISVALAVLARPLVEAVYSAKSLPAAPVLAWLALLGAVRVLAGLSFDVLTGIGHQKRVLHIQLLWLAIAAPALWFGARTAGIEGLAASHALVALVVAVPAALHALRLVLVRGLRPLLPLTRWLLAGGLAAAAGALAMRLVDPAPAQVAVGGLALVVTYLAAGGALGEGRELRKVLRPGGGRRPA